VAAHCQVWLCLAEIVMLFQPLMHSKNQIALANNLVTVVAGLFFPC